MRDSFVARGSRSPPADIAGLQEGVIAADEVKRKEELVRE